MKEKKTKKAPSAEEQLTLTRVSVIVWSILAVIWFGLGITKTATGDDWWIIVLDFFVGALSAVDAVLGLIRLKKLKAAVGSACPENDEKNGNEL